jgi:hypothetical protein
LQRAEFTLDNNDRATSSTVRIDSRDQPRWKFGLHYLDEMNVVAVALGPPSEIISGPKPMLSFATLFEPTSDHANKPFQILTSKDLLI